MANGKCAIWGTAAQAEPKRGDYDIYNSPRAGGKYKITGTAEAVLRSNYDGDERFKAKLTSWLVEQHISGVAIPEIVGHNYFFQKIFNKNLVSTTERLNRFFACCNLLNIRFGEDFISSRPYKNTSSDIIIFGSDYLPANLLFYAYSECLNESDWQIFMKMLKELGYIDINNRLTYKAYERIDSLSVRKNLSEQAFIAMWFNKETDAVYKNGIKQAVIEAGFKPFRVDDKEHNNKIDDEIVAEIRRSRFVIADFTCGFSNDNSQAIARGGVYYEAGFAQGLGLPVIWTCHKDIIAHVHFDTRQYNHIVWETAADLKEKLLNRIRATIT